MIDYAAVGVRIKRLRLRRGITQEKLGERIGISTKHISNIETNNAHPSTETLVEIANQLHSSVDYLLSNDVEETQNSNYHKDFVAIMETCSRKEKNMIIEMMYALKKVLDEHDK